MLSYFNKTQLMVFKKLCEDNKYSNISYPVDCDFDFSELKDFLDYCLNNCGDHEKSIGPLINSFDFENEVISYFTKLFKGRIEDIYGYITNGGTEGNMWGLYIARELYPNGIVYFSKDSHYSAAKNISILRMGNKVVESQKNGEMDYKDLEKKIDKSKPVIIFANIGTTAKGAIDDVKKIRKILEEKGVKDIYIHADEALSGAILSFIDNPEPHTFEDGIDSLAISGHKGFGTPIPCGVALAKRKYTSKISMEIDYIKSTDITISGSRNGITPLFLWYVIKSMRIEKMRERVYHKLELAKYVVDELNNNNVKAWRNNNSITVITPKPSESFIHTHNLAPFGDNIHIITTAHNSRTTLNKLIYELILDYKINNIKL